MRRTKVEVKKIQNYWSNHDNIDTVKKQHILEIIVKLIKKDNLPNPQNQRKTDI